MFILGELGELGEPATAGLQFGGLIHCVRRLYFHSWYGGPAQHESVNNDHFRLFGSKITATRTHTKISRRMTCDSSRTQACEDSGTTSVRNARISARPQNAQPQNVVAKKCCLT
jgi:hypothetical protein